MRYFIVGWYKLFTLIFIITLSNFWIIKAPSTTTINPPYSRYGPCSDDLKECPTIAKSGKCMDRFLNHTYYVAVCRKSCNYCIPNLPCVDPDWCKDLSPGFCERFSPEEIIPNRAECPKKCRACEKNSTTVAKFTIFYGK